MPVKVPFSVLGRDTPNTVKVVVDESQIEISTNKTQVISASLLVLSAILLIIIIAVLIRLKKITFNRLTDTMSAIYVKFTRKPPQNPDSL